jgi:hypothetical protein
MEPLMDQNNDKWKEWSVPDPSKFFKVFSHKTYYNNNEWCMNKTYNELTTDTIINDKNFDGILSTVLSSKYS